MNQNLYDATRIYAEIQKDITKNRWMIFLSGFIFFVLLIVIFPLTIWFFLGLLFYADLPSADHELIPMVHNTTMFLVPYNILLIYYFIIMYFQDKKLHMINKIHFQKAVRYFVGAMIVSFLPFIFSDHTILTLIYFIFFVLTIYNLSLTYYDVTLNRVHNIHKHLYRSEDLGWMSSMGLLDNPFSIQDDINRGKLFVQMSTVGFDFMKLFIEMVVRSFIFAYAIRDKHYIHESARLFDLILEEDLETDYARYSVFAKIILESIGYASFRNGQIVLYTHGETVSTLAKIKEEK